jgi:uncharacterized iron-regulated membrane protein
MSKTMPSARKPLLSRVPADFVRAVLKGHSALGLAFAAIIYLVCLTGSVAVFAREFERWEQAGAPHVERASPEAVQRALAAAVAQGGSEIGHGYIQMPSPDLPRLHISLETGKGDRAWIADAKGTLTADAGTPWTEFLTRLHINLHLPRTWGIFLVGLTGVALLSSLISGVLAHPRIFRDAFHLRLGGARRLQEADLHNRLGVWALPFHVLVSLTGALLGLTTLIVGVLGFALFQGDVGKVYALFIPAEPKEDPRHAPVMNLVPMFAEVARRAPDGRVDLILLEHPTERGGAAMFNVERTGKRLSNVDAYAFHHDGRIYSDRRSADKNLGESILVSIGKLHFGWFGGGIVKVAYALLGLALSYLAAGGVTIWLARRRDKRRPAPRLERVWASVVWGQPAALSLAALVAVAAGNGIAVALLIAVWGGATLAALAGAIRLTARRLSASLRLATAGILAACGLLHIALRSGADPVAWAVDLVLIAGGAAIAWTIVAKRGGVAKPAMG